VSGAMPAGPAMTTLRSVIAYMAAPALAVAWGAAMAVYLRKGSPSSYVACADCAVYVGLALGAANCVPPGARDAALSWLVISMSGQLIVPAWYAPRALFTPLALTSPAAYFTGAVTQPAPDIRKMAATSVLLLTIGLIHAYGRRQLYGHAAAADAALAWADQAASEQFALMAATIERREHERLLHDTVLNTLTALGRAGGDDVTGAVNRCRQDVALIEEALRDPSELAGGAGHPSEDLLGELRAVVAGMRARGLAVHLEAGDSEGVPPVPPVPARVAAAISNAAREALSNVVAHAGTGEAWLWVRSVGLAEDAGVPCRVDVIVRDRGAGFDLARVDPARLGLRRSIKERIADCGGRADIWSAPGRGTAVRLSWPVPGPPAEPGQADAARAYRGPGQESLLW
jgi:signal transduction histidine kinase